MAVDIFEYLPRELAEIIACRDGKISDVQIMPDKKVYTKQNGAYTHFCNLDADFLFILNEIASESGMQFNRYSPIMSVHYGGVRIEAHQKPISNGSSACIRIPAHIIYTLEDYLNNMIMTSKHYDVLCQSIADDRNIGIAGGTSSGKTTLTTAMLQKDYVIKPWKHIVTIQDIDELVVPNPIHRKLFTNTLLSITGRQLTESAMRCDPDAIHYGEWRDGNALYGLQAGNTGHKGCYFTIHANSVESTPDRIKDLCYTNPELKFAPNRMIEEAVDLIVHIEAVRDIKGRFTRRVTGIGELVGYVKSKDKFEFKMLA